MTGKQKKKLGIWGIVVAVVITAGVFVYIAVTAGVFAAKDSQEKAIINQVWGGKAPTAAEEKKIVNDVVNSPWPPPNPFLTTPVTPAPVVAPPVARSDFKVEYRETASAKGNVKFVIGPSDPPDPRMAGYRVKNLTNKPLLIKRFGEQRDGVGKILDTKETEWYKMDPFYEIPTSNWEIQQGTKKMTFWVEIKDAE